MVIVAIGVSGSGKSSLGQALARAIGADFQEGDDLHPPANIDKLHAGVPLDDTDRAPWLERIAIWIAGEQRLQRTGVVSARHSGEATASSCAGPRMTCVSSTCGYPARNCSSG
jgi:carbohydrate kinase (thermoresistant glucokinase family)